MGILFIFLPPVLLVGTIVLYAVMGFVLSSAISSTSEAPTNQVYVEVEESDAPVTLVEAPESSLTATAGSIVSGILSLIGFVAIIGLFVGIPIGAWLLVSASRDMKTKKPEKKDQTS